MKRKGLTNLAVLAGTVFVGLLIGECGVRLTFPEMAGLVTDRGTWTHDSELGWRGIPNLEVLTRVGEDRMQVRTNEHGYRDETFTTAKSPNKKRLILFGDSMTYGLGVEEEDRFDASIERLSPDLEVWSTGVSAYATDQELLTFRRLAPELQPDVVGVVFVPNDPLSNSGPYGHGYPKPYFVLGGDGGLTLKNVPVPKPNWKLRAKYALQRYCALCNFVRIVGAGLVPKITDEGIVGTVTEGATPPPPDVGWDVTLALLETFAREAKASGAEFFIVACTSHVQLEEGDHPLNVKLLEWCRAKNIRCVETFEALRAYEASHPNHHLFLPDGHWDVDGHRVAGETIQAALVGWGLTSTTADSSR